MEAKDAVADLNGARGGGGEAPPPPPPPATPLLPVVAAAAAAAVRTATVVDMESGEGMMLDTGIELRVWIVE